MKRAMLPGLVLLALAAPAAQAFEVRPLIKGGLDAGGETMVTVTFIDGSTEKIKANQGLYLGAGVSMMNDEKSLELEISLSYKISLIHADNGDVEFTRVPLDVMLFYRWPNFRLGGGLTYHMSPRLQSSGAVSNPDVDFDSAAGLALQAEYLFTPKFGLGLRYINLRYKAPGFTGDAKSDGVGLTTHFRF